jgi:methyl-accepting chemotaxis protein
MFKRRSLLATERRCAIVAALAALIADQSTALGSSSAAVEEMIANVESVAGNVRGAAEINKSAGLSSSESARNAALIAEVKAAADRFVIDPAT